LELNGINQFLVYADDVTLLGKNVNSIKEETQTLLDASKEGGLEVKVENTKNMFVSCYHTAR
jgi:hypothetical protein